LERASHAFSNSNELLHVDPLKKYQGLKIHVLTAKNIRNSQVARIDICKVIAQAFGRSIDDLKALNARLDCSGLKEGDILVIGKVTNTPTKVVTKPTPPRTNPPITPTPTPAPATPSPGPTVTPEGNSNRPPSGVEYEDR
jgi:hypothetical protein